MSALSWAGFGVFGSEASFGVVRLQHQCANVLNHFLSVTPAPLVLPRYALLACELDERL